MDLPHLWLPYTQMQTAPEPLAVARTEGCKIILEDGRELIDGIASWWTACHGYNHPHIKKRVSEQLERMPHVMFAGLVHEPAKALAAKLIHLAPEGLSRVFFSDSGSIAVEVALKMALQYWQNKGEARRQNILFFNHAYHGDTMGCMAVSNPGGPMHAPFKNLNARHFQVEIPQDEYSFAEFEELLDGIHKQVAAIIIEPLVQAAGGMRFHGADVLEAVARLAKKYGILLIADEIATGFGRTGMMFACEEAGITPDIMCVGKALTGGTMTLAATLAKEDVFNAFLDESLEKALMHGPTFTANPLACAAALASLELFETEPRLSQVEAIEAQLFEELSPCRHLPGVIDVRIKGAIGVVEIDPARHDAFALRKRFVEQGVWLRPFGNVVYVMPPFVIPKEALSKVTGAVRNMLSENCY